jgi:uncharacterized protein YjbI with pentapeptide repeats
LKDANLDGCDVENCFFDRSILIGAIMTDLTNEEGAKMEDCIYKNEDMHLFTKPDPEVKDKK